MGIPAANKAAGRGPQKPVMADIVAGDAPKQRSFEAPGVCWRSRRAKRCQPDNSCNSYGFHLDLLFNPSKGPAHTQGNT
jgi:hypothetical protein